MNPYSDKKDEILVELTLLGKEKAYAELVLRHQHAVMGTAFKVTNNSHLAEDASQDAFVSAWMNLSSLRDGAKFRSWVCSIARNCAKTLHTHYRSAIPDISFHVLENHDITEADEACEWLGGDGQDAAELHMAVEALGEKLRETVKLHYFEDKSCAEIAEIMGVSVGTVKWRLSEGRKQLRKGYGMMEKTYDENESLLTRVMRQVEELKLWRIKNNKTGFEEEYRAVLLAVEELKESKEKNRMLADTLMLGYWWVPGTKNDEVFARIKRAAEAGHNDDVMQYIAAVEHEKLNGQAHIDFIENTQIPYYREHHFPKTLAYVWFWLGYAYRDRGDLQKAIQCYQEVLTLLSPQDVYYALAKAAVWGESRCLALRGEGDILFCEPHVVGEVYKKIGDTWYFWTQPGYGNNYHFAQGSLFWKLSACDSILWDSSMRVGDRIGASGGQTAVTYVQNDAVCDTPAGHFASCSVFIAEGNTSGLTYCKTWLAPGVGIVRQIGVWHGETYEWVLARYTVNGGEGLLPFAVGNRWEYDLATPEYAHKYERDNIFEVIACEGDTVTVSNMTFVLSRGYYDTWEGQMAEVRERYCRETGDGHGELCDVRHAMQRAEELAETKRQKRHTQIANEVMYRIFDTDPKQNPDYTQKGTWNFFEYWRIERKDGKVMQNDDRQRSFEWKDMGWYGYGYRVFYSFFLTVLAFATDGCLWSDEWVDGYSFKERNGRFGTVTRRFSVSGGETVNTPAGTFADCRRIRFEFESQTDYFNGQSDFWFAPGVGVVRFEHPYWGGNCAVWELTAYRGTGEGYFPTDDGLFRRYEPKDLGNGWHGSVEYTFDTDESGTVVFKDALGTRDRADYEASPAKR